MEINTHAIDDVYRIKRFLGGKKQNQDQTLQARRCTSRCFTVRCKKIDQKLLQRTGGLKVLPKHRQTEEMNSKVRGT